ncbi:MAG: deoxyribonuclease IV [Christensenella sp.]|nr:deoxyribonuclease IV [Christensenella sp.]
MERTTLYLGCHLSNAKGYAAAGRVALSIGANTFQFFTRNPRGGNAKAIDPDDADALNTLAREHQFGTLVAHAPYTLNLSSADPRVRDFAYRCLGEDLARMEYFPGQVYNLHPGSHVGQGISTGIRQTVNLINEILAPGQSTTVLYETMSGGGSEIGGSFEQIAELLSGTALQNRIGVCLDTCHVFAAGYDVKNDLDGVLETFDKIVGLRWLKALHLNDSLFDLGFGKDRHARIGEGFIGLDVMRRIARHEAFRGLPMILETPNEPPEHGEEIRQLRA